MFWQEKHLPAKQALNSKHSAKGYGRILPEILRRSGCFREWWFPRILHFFWILVIILVVHFYTTHLWLFSFWHLVKALHKLGSGHKSSGVWPFLFLTAKSAPLATKKQAILAELFLSPEPGPAPSPISNFPTSCMSWSCLNWDRVWCLYSKKNKYIHIFP